MKVLMINNAHYVRGGADSVYFNTAELLIELGHDVIFFSKFDGKNVDFGLNSFFAKSSAKLGKIKSAINYVYNIDVEDKLEQLIVSEKPDIAHVHLFWGGLSSAIFKPLKKHNIPLVHTVHDYRMVCPAYTFKNLEGNICEDCKGKHFYKCALNRCSKGSILESILMSYEMYYRNKRHNPIENISQFIFVSDFAYKKHNQYDRRFNDSNSVVLYNFYQRKEPLCCDYTKRNYLLYYGRLSHEKGINTLLDAIIRFPDILLKVVGGGPEEAKLKALVEQNHMNNVEFLGFKRGKELTNLISNARFVVIPSEWYENNPMTIVEAYSFGVPVIGADIGGIPEIINENVTGYIFESKNAKDLSAKIKLAFSLDLNNYVAMSQAALDFANSNFNSKVHGNKIIDIYKRTIQNSLKTR